MSFEKYPAKIRLVIRKSVFIYIYIYILYIYYIYIHTHILFSKGNYQVNLNSVTS